MLQQRLLPPTVREISRPALGGNEAELAKSIALVAIPPDWIRARMLRASIGIDDCRLFGQKEVYLPSIFLIAMHHSSP